MESDRVGSWVLLWRRFRRDRLALVGTGFIVLLVLPLRDPNHGYYELMPADGRPIAPGSIFWLGSDPNGRDLFSRLIWGARISLFIGFIANGMALVVGVVIGTIAAYFGKWVDNVLSRGIDGVE